MQEKKKWSVIGRGKRRISCLFTKLRLSEQVRQQPSSPESFQPTENTTCCLWVLVTEKVIQQQSSHTLLHQFTVGRMKDHESKVIQGETSVCSFWNWQKSCNTTYYLYSLQLLK